MNPEFPYGGGLRYALNIGTTLTTRFWLALSMILFGAGFLFNQNSFLAAAPFTLFNSTVDIETWAVVFIGAGSLGMWRALSPSSKPICGWLINSLILFVWITTTMLRIWNGGNYNPASLLSTHTGFLLMAAWCLMRTEATHRDTETA